MLQSHCLRVHVISRSLNSNKAIVLRNGKNRLSCRACVTSRVCSNDIIGLNFLLRVIIILITLALQRITKIALFERVTCHDVGQGTKNRKMKSSGKDSSDSIGGC